VTEVRCYGDLAELRQRLVAGGEDGWARRLLTAERSAATSGEAISDISPILEDLLATPIPAQLGLRDRIVAVLEFGRKAWDESNQ
jgi:hypothetical protein